MGQIDPSHIQLPRSGVASFGSQLPPNAESLSIESQLWNKVASFGSQLPSDTDEVLRSGGQIVIDVSTTGGCSKMYVWGLNKSLMWCGIVPLSNGDIEIPLILDPNTKTVTYSGLEIPTCPEVQEAVIERFIADHSKSECLELDFVRLVAVVAIFFAAYCIWKLIWG